MKTPEYYYAKDPYYVAGAQILNMAPVQAQTNSQAVAIPLIQGLLGGGLAGYGSKRAQDAGYQDYRKIPGLGAGYESEERPKDWDIYTGMTDRLQMETRAEAAAKIEAERAKQQAAMEKFLMGKSLRATPTGGVEVDPDMLAAKKQILEEEEKIKGKYSKGITVNNSTVPNMGVELKSKVTKVIPIAEAALRLAEKLKASEVGYFDFLTGKMIPKVDKKLLNTDMNALMSAIGYADSGANLSESEKADREKIMGGSWTLDPKEAADFLENFGRSRLMNAQATWDVANEIDAGTLPDRIAMP